MTDQSLAQSYRASAQDLAIFAEFQGERYEKIKSLYRNDNFIEELERIKINIQGGFGMSIGARPAQARSIFFDDGSVLRKYNGSR